MVKEVVSVVKCFLVVCLLTNVVMLGLTINGVISPFALI